MVNLFPHFPMPPLYSGHRRTRKVDPPKPIRRRLPPHEVWFPPDDGYPRLRWKAHEVLWLMSRGVPDIEITRLVGCHRSYPGIIRGRFSALPPEQVLKVFRQIPWPHEF